MISLSLYFSSRRLLRFRLITRIIELLSINLILVLGGHLGFVEKDKATDFDELSDELSFDFVDKNGNEAKYVEIMDIDVDNLLEQIDNGTLEVSDPCAYWLVEGWLIAYFARVNGTDEDALISWLENDSHTVTRNSFQAFWVVVK